MGAVATDAMPQADPRRSAPASLRDLATAAGISLPAVAFTQYDRYRDLLLAWNTRHNLTAIREPAEIDRRLFLDTLLLLPAIDAATTDRDRPPRLIDVGSGAGFPGLALKIARPEIEVTLVEATGKKVAFLQTVIADLGLGGVTARHVRAEELAHDPAHRAGYDLATARAVATLPALLELCLPFLRTGGRALFPKGLDLAEELAAGRRAAPLVGARLEPAVVLPGGQTSLVVAVKTGPTPERYPRRAGIPAREPLGSPSGRGRSRDQERAHPSRPGRLGRGDA